MPRVKMKDFDIPETIKTFTARRTISWNNSKSCCLLLGAMLTMLHSNLHARHLLVQVDSLQKLDG